LENIQRLPLDEKMALLEALMRAVNDELRQESRSDAPRADEPLPPFEELQGILATTTPLPAEDHWKDDYADYLTKKYA